jgi:hypothetical protein
MTTTPTICGLYTRVSSRNHAEADYSSLETQVKGLKPIASAEKIMLSFGFTKMVDIPPTPWTALH